MTYPCMSYLQVCEADALPPSHEEGSSVLCPLCVADMSGLPWCRLLHAEAAERKVPLVPHSNVLEITGPASGGMVVLYAIGRELSLLPLFKKKEALTYGHASPALWPRNDIFGCSSLC